MSTQYSASFASHNVTSPSAADASSSSAPSRPASRDPAGRPGGRTSDTQHAPVRGRLPATIEASLVTSSQITRQAFADALARDQRAALQPVYGAPFRSANDVVQRLLPYHVYTVRDADIIHVLRCVDGADGSTNRTATISEELQSAKHVEAVRPKSTGHATTRSKDRQHGKRLASVLSVERMSKRFPSDEQARSLWERYIGVHARAKRLRRSMVETSAASSPAPFVQESLYHLENAAWEHERELFLKGQDNLRLAREQAVAAGVTWEAIMRVTSGQPEAEEGKSEDASTGSESSSSRSQQSSANSNADVEEGEDEDGEGEIDESIAEQATVDRPSPAAKRAILSADQATVVQPTTQSVSLSSAQLSRVAPTQGSVLSGIASTPQGSSSAQASSGKPALTAVAGAQPVRRGRGRPRKERDEHGRIIRTPAVAQAASSPSAKLEQSTAVKTQSGATKSASAPNAPKPSNVSTTPTAIGDAPTAPTSNAQPNALASASPLSTLQSGIHPTSIAGPSGSGPALPATAATIPTQPIRLALPLSAIKRLTSLAVSLVPAPHLQAAFAAQQMTSIHQGTSAEDVLAVLGRTDIAPRPPPVQQQDAALLLGMTSTALGTKESPSGQQQDDSEDVRVMHVSVILSKLGPSQLSGLAALMQDIQQASRSAASRSYS